MATFNKFDQFVEDKNHGVHDFSSDTLKLYLTNTVPSASADAVKGDLAGISGYTEPTITVSSSGQTAGVYKLVLADVTITAAGPVGPFRYVVIYNDTPASPVDPLIGWVDYGSSITMVLGEDFVTDFSVASGAITDS
jgi:hypothetical protein